MRKKIIFALAVTAFFFSSVSLAVSFDRKRREELSRQAEFFSDTLAIVDSDYVDEVKPKDLVYGALKGMLSSLDPHSQFMDPDTYNELKIDTEGEFGGLGIEISLKDNLPTIVTPLEDTPAWKAGLKPGDQMVKINGELTRGMGLSDTMKKLRGKPQEAVNLTILRESEKQLLEFKVTRAIIKINDIKEAKILAGDIGYIRLIEFRETTPKDFNSAFEKLAKLKIRGLILDLRNNPGGVLESAVEVTSKFIPKDKLILSTKGRKEDQNLIFNSQESDPNLSLPIAVLINEGSASGSEILAAALQDYQRAKVIGVKSFGKGLVQAVIPLPDGSALRLTTSRYLTPLGKEINGKGVIPDITVENPKKQEATAKRERPGKPERSQEYQADQQVMAAVHFLKSKSLENKLNR